MSPRPKTPQQQRKEERREEKRGDRRRERRGERGREGDGGGGGGGGAAGACFSLQWADNEPRVGHSDVRRMGAGEAASLNM